ncbi:MAG: hypothetical protein JZU47_13895 [Prolixibacteraceae bacterium]|nr:hypothetical protein [Prolixibacteraceae bacterium]
MKKQLLSILIVGMAFGTAWAIRGQFGHEQGAAWAGGIGALALILAAKRQDWYAKMLPITLASLIGWGSSGMISYGMVVGYGHSDNFPNAFYGLLMLFVIGCLYGILGGGLVGLSLESTKEKKVKWGALFSEIVAGGIIGYYLLIVQFEWLMTPPRDEMWAVSMGAGLALLWHMVRNKYQSPIRVALYSAIGAGFGFAFGNFLQILGGVMEIHFNMWNVMEYSIGFFGGLGMSYGVFSSVWPADAPVPERWESRISVLVVFVAIPLIILADNLGYKTLMERIKDPSNPETSSFLSTLFGGLIILTVAVIGYYTFLKSKARFERKDVLLLFIVYLSAYISISYIVSGLFAGVLLLNHHLYWLNFFLLLWLIGKQFPAFFDKPVSEMNTNRWLLYLVGVAIVVALLAFIAVNSHGEMSGAHDRFPL